MKKSKRSLNLVILSIISPVLLGVGIINFFLPAYTQWINTHLYNNLFLIVAGVVGIAITLTKSDLNARRYNLALGMVYIYFVVANFAGLYPAFEIDWRAIDDTLHLFMAMSLTFVGIHGKKKESTSAMPYMKMEL